MKVGEIRMSMTIFFDCSFIRTYLHLSTGPHSINALVLDKLRIKVIIDGYSDIFDRNLS